MSEWAEFTGFDWDAGNSEKNWSKHRASDSECEEVSFNRPLIVRPDIEHSGEEPRSYALGQTERSRWLFVVFTVRGELIRVISARDMTRRERYIYESYEKTEEEGHPEI